MRAKKSRVRLVKTLVNICLIRWTYPVALRMGFAKGEIVLEVGYGPDCDDELRTQIKEIVGTE